MSPAAPPPAPREKKTAPSSPCLDCAAGKHDPQTCDPIMGALGLYFRGRANKPTKETVAA